MPNRMLRDWTDSDKMRGMSAHGERFFVRLIMKVDDYGCLYADGSLLKAALFPFLLDEVREADISRWTAECEKAGLIVLYEVAGKKYLQIQEFKQRLDKAKNKYPLPTSGTLLTIVPGFRIEEEQKTNRTEQKGAPADFRSIGLIPDMVAAFMEAFPQYPSDPDNDYPACLAIAKKLAGARKWTDHQLFGDCRHEALRYWREIVDFVVSDDWYSKQSISMLLKKWQDLIQSKNKSVSTTHPVKNQKSVIETRTEDILSRFE